MGSTSRRKRSGCGEGDGDKRQEKASHPVWLSGLRLLRQPGAASEGGREDAVPSAAPPPAPDAAGGCPCPFPTQKLSLFQPRLELGEAGCAQTPRGTQRTPPPPASRLFGATLSAGPDGTRHFSFWSQDQPLLEFDSRERDDI